MTEQEKVTIKKEDIKRLNAVDPLFRLNMGKYPSRGKACHTGHKSHQCRWGRHYTALPLH